MPNIQPQPIRLSIPEGEHGVIVDRVLLPTGAVMVQGDLTNWDLAVFDLDGVAPSTALYTLTAQAASALISNVLLTDPRWTLDSTGYNLRHVFVAPTQYATTPATGDPQGAHRYAVEIRMNTVSHGALFTHAIVTLEPLSIA